MKYLVIYSSRSQHAGGLKKEICAASAKEIIGWADADLLRGRSGRTLEDIAGLEEREDEDGNFNYPEMGEDVAFEAALEYFNDDGKLMKVYDPDEPDQVEDFMAEAVSLTHTKKIEACLHQAGFTITEAQNILKDYFEVENEE